MRRFQLCLLIAVVLVATACEGSIDIDIGVDGDDVAGSGSITTEDRTVADFDRVQLAGEGRVIIERGPTSLSIETDDNLLQHIETTVSGGELQISTESGIDIDPTDSVKYIVSTPTLVGVSMPGAGNFDLDSWSVDKFTISVAGAGDIDIASLTATSVEVTISGVGDITIAGTTASLDVTISGAGDFNGADLVATDVVATTSGVGSATVWATGTLDATVSGVGSIDYWGEPAAKETVSGLGDVDSLGAK